MMSPVIDDGLVAAALFKVVIIFANPFYKKISCDFLTFLFAFSSFVFSSFVLLRFCVFAFFLRLTILCETSRETFCNAYCEMLIQHVTPLRNTLQR